MAYDAHETALRLVNYWFRLLLLKQARLFAIEDFRAKHPLIPWALKRETQNRRLEAGYENAGDWSSEDQERWEMLQGAER